MDKQKHRIKIDPNISIPELLEKHPELEEVLSVEFGFHCANCIFAEFDTLEQGAEIHGIVGDYFSEMLEYIEKIVNGEVE